VVQETREVLQPAIAVHGMQTSADPVESFQFPAEQLPVQREVELLEHTTLPLHPETDMQAEQTSGIP